MTFLPFGNLQNGFSPMCTINPTRLHLQYKTIILYHINVIDLYKMRGFGCFSFAKPPMLLGLRIDQ